MVVIFNLCWEQREAILNNWHLRDGICEILSSNKSKNLAYLSSDKSKLNDS